MCLWERGACKLFRPYRRTRLVLAHCLDRSMQLTPSVHFVPRVLYRRRCLLHFFGHQLSGLPKVPAWQHIASARNAFAESLDLSLVKYKGARRILTYKGISTSITKSSLTVSSVDLHVCVLSSTILNSHLSIIPHWVLLKCELAVVVLSKHL